MTTREGLLPVADRPGVRRATMRLVRAEGRALPATLVLNADGADHAHTAPTTEEAVR